MAWKAIIDSKGKHPGNPRNIQVIGRLVNDETKEAIPFDDIFAADLTDAKVAELCYLKIQTLEMRDAALAKLTIGEIAPQAPIKTAQQDFADAANRYTELTRLLPQGHADIKKAHDAMMALYQSGFYGL